MKIKSFIFRAELLTMNIWCWLGILFEFYRKARRKERDGDQTQQDAKLYLEEGVLERKLPDADLRMLVDLPAGLDYNEWLASHSKATLFVFFYFLNDEFTGISTSSIGTVWAR